MGAGPFNPSAAASAGGAGSGGAGIIKGYTRWLHKGSNISVNEPSSPWDLITASNIYNHDYAADPAIPAGASATQEDRIISRARVWSRNSICCPRKFIKGDIYATSKADGTAIDGVTWWPANTARSTIKADAHGGELKYLAYYHFNNDGTIGNYPSGDTHLTMREHLLVDSGFTLEGGRKWVVDFEARAVVPTTEQYLTAILIVQDQRDDIAVAVNFTRYGSGEAGDRDAVYDNNGTPTWIGLFDFQTHPKMDRVTSDVISFDDDVNVYCLARPGTPKTEPTVGLVGDADTYEQSGQQGGGNWRMMQSVTIMEVE